MILFTQMLKEEWRIHSSIVGNLSFALFAVIMLVLCAVFAFAAPVFVGYKNTMVFSHYLFLMFGALVGGFGLGGREVLNRRFGEISFLAHSSRTLPISVRRIFLNFALKDMVYYSLFIIGPFCSSFLLSAFVTPVPAVQALRIFISLPLSFAIGLALSFFFSVLYSRAKAAVQLLFIILAATLFLGFSHFVEQRTYETILLPLTFYFSSSPSSLLVSVLVVLILFTVSTVLFSFEHASKAKSYASVFKRSAKPSTERAFMLKDVIDLHRSQGSFGKVLFSFLVPIMIVEVMINFLLKIFSVSNEGLLVLFSVVIGVTASTVYNWLTEFDMFDKYLFLPVEPRTVMLSKTLLCQIVGGVSGSVMVILSLLFLKASITVLPLALLTFASVFLYTTSVLVMLSGLSPNLLLFDAKVFLKYVLLLAPPIIFLMFESFMYPSQTSSAIITIAGLFFLMISAAFFKTSLNNPKKVMLIS